MPPLLENFTPVAFITNNTILSIKNFKFLQTTHMEIYMRRKCDCNLGTNMHYSLMKHRTIVAAANWSSCEGMLQLLKQELPVYRKMQ